MKHETILIAAAEAYGDPAAVEERVRRFLPMVRKAAWHVHGSGCEGMEVDDLVQVGLLALTEAARRHNGPGEDGFAAYAKIRVRGAMLDVIRRSRPGSRSARQRLRGMNAARDRLRQLLGREPSSAELAADLGISETALRELRAEPIRLQPLDGLYDDGDAAFADARPDPFEALSGAEDAAQLAGFVAALPERLKLVLQLYFVEELNLAEIAAVLAVSVPRVHQLKAQAVALLRDKLTLHA